MTFDVESLKNEYEVPYAPELVLMDENDDDLDVNEVLYCVRKSVDKITLDCCWLPRKDFEKILEDFSEELESEGTKFVFRTYGEYSGIHIYVEVKPVAINEYTVFFEPVDKDC